MHKFKNALFRELCFLRKRPLTAHFELTYRCNLRCKFCGFWKEGVNNKGQELSLQDWVKAVDGLSKLKIKKIVVVGSEPLVRSDVLDIIRYIKEKGFECILITNGTLLDKSKAEALAQAKVDTVSVSVDGTEQIHDAIRGMNGGFKKAMSGIRNLIVARGVTKNHLPLVRIHTTICSLNVRNIDALIDISEQLPLGDFSFQYVVETDKSVIDGTVLDGIKIASTQFLSNKKSLLPNLEGIQSLRNSINKINKSHNKLSLRVLNSLPDSKLQKGQFPIKKCYMVKTDVLIDPYGNVYPCTNMRNYPIGNVKDDSIAALWKSDRFEYFRNVLKKQLFPVCQHCCHYNANLTFTQAAKAYLGFSL